jgi:hypothetical protein
MAPLEDDSTKKNSRARAFEAFETEIEGSSYSGYRFISNTSEDYTYAIMKVVIDQLDSNGGYTAYLACNGRDTDQLVATALGTKYNNLTPPVLKTALNTASPDGDT